MEASKQARRSDVMQVDDPLPLKAALAAAIRGPAAGACEQERSTTLRHALSEALAANGDEAPAIRMAVGPKAVDAGRRGAVRCRELEACKPGSRILRSRLRRSRR